MAHEFRYVQSGDCTIRVAVEGSGPLVLMVHGWPESWYSWRHQLQAVSQAGFRAVAPDMRGYGGTQSPEPIDQYTLYHLVGDMAELVTLAAPLVKSNGLLFTTTNSASLRAEKFVNMCKKGLMDAGIPNARLERVSPMPSDFTSIGSQPVKNLVWRIP